MKIMIVADPGDEGLADAHEIADQIRERVGQQSYRRRRVPAVSIVATIAEHPSTAGHLVQTTNERLAQQADPVAVALREKYGYG